MRDRDPNQAESDGIFEGLNFPAIVHGVFIDMVATLVGSTLFVLALGGTDVLSTDPDTAAASLDALSNTGGYLVGMLVIGALATVLGAYRAAMRAGVHHIRHGGWVAVASTLFIALFSTACSGGGSTAPPPLWYDVVSWLLIIPAGVSGGWIAESRSG